MKSSLISLSLLMVLGTLVCLADDRPIVFDGAFWHTLTKDDKVFFVTGFVEGNRIGFTQGKYMAVDALMDIPGVKGPRSEAAKHTPNNVDTSPYGFGLILDGVDECYKDFRNRNVEVDMCIAWAVAGLQGDDDKSREAWMEAVRQDTAAAMAAKAKAKQ